jgi:lipid-binding SYLF domain-containing protein
MNKFLTFLFLGLGLALVPAQAATREEKLTTLYDRVETCEAILREFMARPVTAIPPQVLEKARAIIISSQFKAGLILGVQDGYGVIMVKRPSGRWSVPALIRTGEASLGFQLGANSTETVYVITDDTTPRILFRSRMNIGVDAKAVAGPKFADANKDNKPVVDAPVLVYTKKAGLYAGATVKSGYLNRDDESNRLLYNTNFNLPELLYSDWITPPSQVQPLIDYVQSLCP